MNHLEAACDLLGHESSSHQQHQPGVGLPLPLMNLYSRPSESLQLPYLRGSLAAATQICPFVVELEIAHCPGEEIRALLSLKNLRRLYLKSMKAHFEENLLPILQKFGPNLLEKLTLEDVNEVDVAAIIKHCPNLRFLVLACIVRYIQSPESSNLHLHHQLGNLQLLVVDQSPMLEAPTSVDISNLLLCSPSIAELIFYGLDNLTDQVIEQAVVFHGFPELNRLQLGSCKNLTKHSINRLLSSNCPIKDISMTSCKKIHKKQVRKWKKMALNKNLDLTFLWMKE